MMNVYSLKLLKDIRKSKLSQFHEIDFPLVKHILKRIAHENWTNDRIHM